MADLKTVGTFAIIIGCFAIIYPRFMHPVVLRVMGIHSDSPKAEEESAFPPNMRQNPQMKDRKPPPMPAEAKDIRQHMRPGPHPGMRAAAEMQKQQSQGSGRGMMGIVLPMYAIGICVYLVYTLFKVFNKRGKYADPYQQGSEHERQPVDSLGFPQTMTGEEEEVQHYMQEKRQQRELEDLLVKMDDTRNVSEEEMRALQKRLEETEAQMTRILQAMQNMQSRMTTTASPAGVPGEDICDNPETVGKVMDEPQRWEHSGSEKDNLPAGTESAKEENIPNKGPFGSSDTAQDDSTLSVSEPVNCEPLICEPVSSEPVSCVSMSKDNCGTREDEVADCLFEGEKEVEGSSDTGIRHRKAAH